MNIVDPVVIAAIITGGCAVAAAIVAGIVAIYQSNKKKKEEKDKVIEVHVTQDKYVKIPIPPTPEHPVFLNPDDYDIDEEEFIITLAALLQRSRSPKDVSVKKLQKIVMGKVRNEQTINRRCRG